VLSGNVLFPIMIAMHLKDALTRDDTHLECFQNNRFAVY